MSWGYKILLTYVVFIVFILGMVYVAMQQTNEMQDSNYYAQELKYQSVIDGKENLQALKEDVRISNEGGNVVIRFQQVAVNAIEEGSIEYLCHSDQSKDLTVPMQADDSGVQQISGKSVKPGYYNVRISWLNDTTSYYSEQFFTVQ